MHGGHVLGPDHEPEALLVDGREARQVGLHRHRDAIGLEAGQDDLDRADVGADRQLDRSCRGLVAHRRDARRAVATDPGVRAGRVPATSHRSRPAATSAPAGGGASSADPGTLRRAASLVLRSPSLFERSHLDHARSRRRRARLLLLARPPDRAPSHPRCPRHHRRLPHPGRHPSRRPRRARRRRPRPDRVGQDARLRPADGDAHRRAPGRTTPGPSCSPPPASWPPRSPPSWPRWPPPAGCGSTPSTAAWASSPSARRSSAASTSPSPAPAGSPTWSASAR